MSDETAAIWFGVMVGVVGAAVGVFIAMMVGHNACISATGADQCVREWRAVEATQ